jgi:aspartate/glutamate racemase
VNTFGDMAILGIIGGIAPPSTIQYYRAVIEKYRERSGGRAPRVLINSLDGYEVSAFSPLPVHRHQPRAR